MTSSSDPHRAPQRTWRPEPDEYDEAKRLLSARGHELTQFLRACVRWLRADPEAALAVLASHWPEPRPRGRPWSETTPSQGE